MKDKHTVTITLTPAQLDALNALAKTERCELPDLVTRGVDTLLATYHAPMPHLEAKLDRMHSQVIKLLVCLMKLVGQAIYFASLPVTTGPLKGRLSEKGIAVQWHQSEKFATDLLKPPASSASNP